MPFVEGQNLTDFLMRNGGRLGIDQAISVCLDIAAGLSALHAHRIVHRDVKPGNVMVQPSGRSCLIDMGISRFLDESTITGPGALLGSVSYMSPEQAMNPRTVDERADIYSLGVILYLLLSGQLPIQGRNNEEMLEALQKVQPVPLKALHPSIPNHINDCCMRCLAKSPEYRYQTAEESRLALSAPAVTAPAKGRFCGSCGQKLPKRSRYCPCCGVDTNGGAAQGAKCLACGSEVARAQVCTGCKKPFSHSGHRLAFRMGSTAGLVFRVPEGIYPVGRDQLCPRDTGISRRHFNVACTNGTLSLEDAGSANGTFVNGRPANQVVQLLAGCEVRIAGNVATYSCN